MAYQNKVSEMKEKHKDRKKRLKQETSSGKKKVFDKKANEKNQMGIMNNISKAGGLERFLEDKFQKGGVLDYCSIKKDYIQVDCEQGKIRVEYRLTHDYNVDNVKVQGIEFKYNENKRFVYRGNVSMLFDKFLDDILE